MPNNGPAWSLLNPKLKRSVCVFFDVLGFRQTTEDAIYKGNPDKFLGRFQRVLVREIIAFRRKFKALDWKYRVFTDNIVLAAPVFDDGEDEFGMLHDALCRCQLEMAAEGFFVRGGVSVGGLHMDEYVIWGPALLEAYDLESKHALFPRIVLSEDMVAMVRKHIGYYDDPSTAPQNSALLMDPDGKSFLNYLDAALIDAPATRHWHLVISHKAKIEAALNKHRGNPRIWDKYYWCATYHNYFCGLVSNEPGYTNNFLVSNKIASRGPDRFVK